MARAGGILGTRFKSFKLDLERVLRAPGRYDCDAERCGCRRRWWPRRGDVHSPRWRSCGKAGSACSSSWVLRTSPVMVLASSLQSAYISSPPFLLVRTSAEIFRATHVSSARATPTKELTGDCSALRKNRPRIGDETSPTARPPHAVRTPHLPLSYQEDTGAATNLLSRSTAEDHHFKWPLPRAPIPSPRRITGA